VFMADRVIVLSRRPGEVLDVVPIELSRPRQASQQGDPVFVETADRIWGLIKSQAQAALLDDETVAEREA
jgi:NitT/TauT family transport system ATP-binding protein